MQYEAVSFQIMTLSWVWKKQVRNVYESPRVEQAPADMTCVALAVHERTAFFS